MDTEAFVYVDLEGQPTPEVKREMSTLSLRIADSLHNRVRELAKRENISINQFVSTALAEKLSALLTQEYLTERAKRGSRRKFKKALSKVRDVPPDDQDALDT